MARGAKDLTDEELRARFSSIGSKPQTQSAADLSDDELKTRFEAIKSKPQEVTFGEKAKAFGLGAAQGATFGFADEATAAAGAVKDVLTGQSSLREAYNQRIEDVRATFEQAEERAPKSFLAGDVGASIASAFVPIAGIAKGTAGLGRLAARGATVGAVSGAGRADDLTSTEGLGKVAASAALGGIAGPVAKGVSKAFGKFATPNLSKVGAQTKILGKKATKFFKDEIRGSAKKAQTRLDKAFDSVNEMEQFNGNLMNRKFFEKTTATQRANLWDEAFDARSQTVGQLIDAADDGAAFQLGEVLDDISPNKLVKFTSQLDEIADDLVGDLSVAKSKGIVRTVSRAIKDNQEFTLTDLQKLKIALDQKIGDRGFRTLASDDITDTALSIRKAIKTKIERVAGGDIKKANSELSALHQVKDLFSEGRAVELGQEGVESALGQGPIERFTDIGLGGVSGAATRGIGKVGQAVLGDIPSEAADIVARRGAPLITGPLGPEQAPAPLDPAIPEDRMVIKDRILKSFGRKEIDSRQMAQKMENLNRLQQADPEDASLEGAPPPPQAPNLDILNNLLQGG